MVDQPPTKLIVVMAFLAVSIGCGLGTTSSAPAIDGGWVLLVRPEGRLYLDNATADWRDYLDGVAKNATTKMRYTNGAECLTVGRRRFEGRRMVPGSQANEALGGQSIQCVRSCRVDPGMAVMVCQEVTPPEIYR
jgi:hypothetical protein